METVIKRASSKQGLTSRDWRSSCLCKDTSVVTATSLECRVGVGVGVCNSSCCFGVGNNAKSVSRQYSLKVTKLEHEAEQAKVELTETRKQLQELESKDLSDVALKVKLQKEFRKKMDAAKLRVQVTYKIEPSNLTSRLARVCCVLCF